MTIQPVLIVPGSKSLVIELFRCDVCINIARPLFYWRDAKGRDHFVCGEHRPQ